MLRSKIRFGFLKEGTVLALSRGDLARQGPAVGTVVARAVEPGPGQLAGMTVRLDGGDKTPPEDYAKNPVSSGATLYDFYSIEVVQRVGYDSFTPDNGVLLSKNLDNEQRGGFHPFTYVIDAHPEDIKMVDFKRPNGTPVMRTVADYRQLNDALFHAGAHSGSQDEWEDLPNRLHFYVVDTHKDAQGVLSYTVAVRSLDGSGPQTRGVQLAAAAVREGACAFTLTNTGTATAGEPAHFDYDVYRLSVTGPGQLWNSLAVVRFAGSAAIAVYPTGRGDVTLKAQSEADPTKSATGVCRQ
jgi:hypothetical protein